MDVDSFLSGGAGGAVFAFVLEVGLRWAERRRNEQDAANRALLTLAHMWEQVEMIRLQGYEETIRDVRQRAGRDPLAVEYLPLLGIVDRGLHIDTGSLAFLLRSHNPNCVNKLALAENGYRIVLAAELKRSELHLRLQSILAAAGVKVGDQQLPPHIRSAPEMAQLESITRDQIQQLPTITRQIEDARDELFQTARQHFPTRRFINFERLGSPSAQRSPAAKWWKRWTRRVVDWIRRNPRQTAPAAIQPQPEGAQKSEA